MTRIADNAVLSTESPPGTRNGLAADQPESAKQDEARGGGNVGASTLPPGSVLTRERFVARLVDLGWRYGDIPIYGSPEWDQLVPADPRRFASVVRAAECWYLDGQPEAVRRRLAEDNWLVRYRVREAGLDVHGRSDTDWMRIHDVVTARAAYRERWGCQRDTR